jgi:hypothetical protein
MGVTINFARRNGILWFAGMFAFFAFVVTMITFFGEKK